MNNFTYENQGTNTYLVYSVDQEDIVDTLGLGMLTNNKIPGIASTIFIQMDDKKYIKYNVSAKVSVKQFFASPVNKKRLLGVFNGIVDAMLAAEEYMLDPRDILLDTEFIFTDVSTCDTVMICLPVEGYKAGEKNLSSFFKNIMFSTAFEQTENCDYVAKIINYLNSAPAFSLNEFKNVLNEIKREVGLTGNTANQPRTVVLQTPPNEATLVKIQQSNNNLASNQKSFGQMQNNMQNNMQNYSGNGIGVPPIQNKTKNAMQNVQGINMQGMNIPIQNTQAQKGKNVQPVMNGQNNVPEKTISMLELLSHYNKENAALYKAQKNAKKIAKEEQKKAKNKPMKGQNQPNIQVPSQKSPGQGANFAIPGQIAPVSNPHFNVPGQTPGGQVPQKGAQQNNGSKQMGIPSPNSRPQGMQPQGMMSQQGGMKPQGMMSQQGGMKPQGMMAQQRGMSQAGMVQPQGMPQGGMVQPQGMPQGGMVQPQGMPQQNMMAQQNMAVHPGTVNFGETSVLSSAGIGETTVLSNLQPGAQAMKPYLVRSKNNEKILIDKPVFRIGKEKSYVDYFISDNTAISRSHANIICRENEYYILDTNSTNHTFINGTMIGSNSEMKLTSGDKVRLANEEFEFKFF